MAEGGALRELLAIFDLEVPTEDLEKGTHHVEGFIGKLKAVGGIVAEAFAVNVVREFFAEQIEGAAHVQDLAERLDVGAASLKEFGMVAAGSGVDFDSAAHSLGKLSKNLGEAALGGGEAGATFAQLGVHLKDAHGAARPLLDIVEDVGEGLSKLPDQTQRNAAAMKIFGREGAALVPVLAKGKEALRETFEEAKALGGGLGDDYYENAKKAREESEKFGFVMQTIKSKITLLALPAITSFFERIKKLGLGFIDVTKHSYVLQTAAIALSALLGFKLAGSLVAVAKVLGILKPGIVATVEALFELAAPILLVGLLYLVFDDLYTLMKGGKSVIGDTLDALFGLGTGAELGLALNAIIIDGIRIFSDLGRIIVDVVLVAVNATADGIIALGKAMGDIASGDFAAAGKEFTDGFRDIPALTEKIKSAASDLAEVYKTGGAHGRNDALLGAGINPASLLAQENAPGGGSILNGKGPLHVAAGRVLQTREPQSFERTGGVTQTNTFHTTVHTSSGKPHEIGEAVGAGVATSQEKATNNALKATVRQ